MNLDQKDLLSKILETGLSNSGSDALKATLSLERDNSLRSRGIVDWLLFNYNPNNYFISFFGKPTDDQWSFRFEGHHTSFTFNSSRDGEFSVSPAFIGTTMSKVLIDSNDGKKEVEPLKPVIQEIHKLTASLTPEQIKVAAQSLQKVPMFNLAAPGLFGGSLDLSSVLPPGLKLVSMNEIQKQVLKQILVAFQSNFDPQASELNSRQISEDEESLELIWAGDINMEKPFYLRIQGRTFTFELNCSESSATHYHAAWSNR